MILLLWPQLIGLGLISWVKDRTLWVASGPWIGLAQSLSVAVVKMKWTQGGGRLRHRNGVMMADPEGVTVEWLLCHLTYRCISTAMTDVPGHQKTWLNPSGLISPTSSLPLVFLWKLSVFNRDVLPLPTFISLLSASSWTSTSACPQQPGPLSLYTF